MSKGNRSGKGLGLFTCPDADKPQPKRSDQVTKYVLVYEHEYGLDCYLFEFQPSGDKPYPSEFSLAEHFGLDFEPAKGERLTAVPINSPDSCPRFTADQIGRSAQAHQTTRPARSERLGTAVRNNSTSETSSQDMVALNLPRIELGEVVSTPGALEALESAGQSPDTRARRQRS